MSKAERVAPVMPDLARFKRAVEAGSSLLGDRVELDDRGMALSEYQDGLAEALAEDEVTVRLARHLYKLRRRREASFGAELFSEPAWDILLHLFVAAAEYRTVSVSAACDGAAAPPTTALRKLRQLEEARLIVRVGDPGDARRSYVRLSPKALRKMRNLLKGGCPQFGTGS